MDDQSSRFYDLRQSARDSDAGSDSYSSSSFSSEFHNSIDTSINDGVWERRSKIFVSEESDRKKAVAEKKIIVQHKDDATSGAGAMRELLPTMRKNSILDGGKWQGGNPWNEKDCAEKMLQAKQSEETGQRDKDHEGK